LTTQFYSTTARPARLTSPFLAKVLTLTNLYNERPVWLDNAHRSLDAAVAEAYGWKSDLSDEQLLTKLLTLNVARAEEGK
jgi:hypothetical protein